MKSKILMGISIFLSIIFMSVGYSTLNANLFISGEAFLEVEKDIKITNVVISNIEIDAYETFNSSYIDNQTYIHVTLPNQNSLLAYEIEVTNSTDNTYYLESINELLNSNYNISYDFTNQESLFFSPNSVSVIELNIFYDNSITDNISLSLNLRYNFVNVPFEKLDYIVSTGKQYIDTGVMNTGDYVFESEFLPDIKANKEGFWLFSGRKVTNYTLGLYFFIGTSYNYTINAYGGSTAPYTTKTFGKNIWYDMYFSRNYFTINSVIIPVTANALVPETEEASILLGGNLVNWDGTVDIRHFQGKIKYFKITDIESGDLLRNFVPVKLDDTSEVCYWDTVTKKYYSNIGTGVFLEP